MTKITSTKKVWLELHLSVFLFGISGLFAKLIAAGPLLIVFGRCLFAAVALLLFLRLFNKEAKTAASNQVAIILCSGVLLSVHWLAFFHSIQLSTVALGLVGVATFPMFVTFLEPLLSARRIRVVDLLSAGLVLIGLTLVAPNFDFSHTGSLGLLWAVFSGFLFAVLTLINGHLVKENSSVRLTLYQQLIAGLILLPFIVIEWETPSFTTITLLAFLGVICTALPHTIFVKALAQLSAQAASILACLEPIYGILFAGIILSELPDVKTILGAGIVISAVIFATNAHRPAAEHRVKDKLN